MNHVHTYYPEPITYDPRGVMNPVHTHYSVLITYAPRGVMNNVHKQYDINSPRKIQVIKDCVRLILYLS